MPFRRAAPTLHLQGRGIFDLGPDLANREVFSLDASCNQLTNIRGLSRFAMLGFVDLTGNPLPLEALRALRDTVIFELQVGKAADRMTILQMLPQVWVLDGRFVTLSERVAASAATPAPVRPPFAPSSAPFELLRAQFNTSPASPVASAWQREALAGVGSDAVFRLKLLLEHYTAHAIDQNHVLSQRARGNKDTQLPLPHAPLLRILPPGELLDVAALLAVQAAAESELPRELMREAFVLALLARLGGAEATSVATDISRLPPYVATALVSAAAEELRLRGTAAVLTPEEESLWQALPAAVAGGPETWPLICQHALLLLARCPSCPALAAATPPRFKGARRRAFLALRRVVASAASATPGPQAGSQAVQASQAGTDAAGVATATEDGSRRHSDAFITQDAAAEGKEADEREPAAAAAAAAAAEASMGTAGRGEGEAALPGEGEAATAAGQEMETPTGPADRGPLLHSFRHDAEELAFATGSGDIGRWKGTARARRAAAAVLAARWRPRARPPAAWRYLGSPCCSSALPLQEDPAQGVRRVYREEDDGASEAGSGAADAAAAAASAAAAPAPHPCIRSGLAAGQPAAAAQPYLAPALRPVLAPLRTPEKGGSGRQGIRIPRCTTPHGSDPLWSASSPCSPIERGLVA